MTDIFSLPSPVQSPLVQQLHQAVDKARDSRHTDRCVCGLYRPEGGPDKGSPHCSLDEYSSCKTVNRILDTIRRASF